MYEHELIWALAVIGNEKKCDTVGGTDMPGDIKNQILLYIFCFL